MPTARHSWIHVVRGTAVILVSLGRRVVCGRRPTGRHSWSGVVRGTAVILVILVHAMQGTELFTGHEFTRLETLTIIVTPLRLPAMFLLSGLFVTRSLAKGSAV